MIRHIPLERRKYILATEVAHVLGIAPDRFRKDRETYINDYSMPRPIPRSRPCRYHKKLMQVWLDAYMAGMEQKKLKLHMAEAEDSLLTSHLPQAVANENDQKSLKDAEQIAIARTLDPARLGRK